MRQNRDRPLRVMPNPGISANYGTRTRQEQLPPEQKIRTVSDIKPNIRRIALVNMDYTLLISMILLVLIGIVMVYSASYYVAGTSARFGHDMFRPVRSQIMAAIMGFGALIIMTNFSYHKHLRKLSFLAYIAAVVLLILTVLIGEDAGGARRWINLPVIGRFQPSEVAKLSLIMLMAHMIAAKRKMADNLVGIGILSIFIGVLTVIVGIGTNNMSSAIIIIVIGFGTIFIASSRIWLFVAGGAVGVAGLIALLATGAGFRAGRFAAWLDPFADPTGSGFQIIQSLFAIGSGGMFGLGLGQSRQKLGFIPEAHNDIIFSVIAEELGFVGAALVLFLFGVYLWRAIKIALNAKDLYGCLLATGIALMIGSQALINIAVVTNSIPNTGVPLPFISHGGTSLLVLMTATGILLNISRYQSKD